MADIQRGITFTNSIPDAASAHQLVDSATILPAFITGKTISTPATGDSFVFSKNGALLRCTLAGLIGAFPTGGAANIAALRKLGTAADTAAAGNDPRFPARLNGIRKANGVNPDTVATAQNFTLSPVNLGTGTLINWTLGNVFYATLTANRTYTITGAIQGQSIDVLIKLNGFTLTGITGTSFATLGSGTTFAYVHLTQMPGFGPVGFRVNI